MGLLAGAAALAVTLAACSSSSSTSTTTTTSGGHSSTTVTAAPSGNNLTVGPGQPVVVGSIATLTGAIASNFNGTPAGMQAYFNMINAQGGVNGHKFQLGYNLDDASNPATFSQLSHTLIEQDHVFAVLASTYWFTPNLFVSTGTPTFGYNVSGNWAPAHGPGAPNLLAAGGSTQRYDLGAPAVAYAIKKTNSHSIAVISYGPSITSSYNSCAANASLLSKAGLNVTTLLDAQLAGSYTSEVQKMQSAGVDFIVSCMQASDNVSMTRDLQQYGLNNVHQLWFDGYDDSLLHQYNALMQGVYLNVNNTVPFTANTIYPGRYPGIAEFESAMQKSSPSLVHSQEALQGWVSAATLVQGVKMAGNNVTQANVVQQINTLNSWTAGDVFDITNWTIAHNNDIVSYPLCSAFVQVKGNQFVPALNKAPAVFNCYPQGTSLKNPQSVPAPSGTPGQQAPFTPQKVVGG